MLLGIGLWFTLILGLRLELWFALAGDDAQGLGLDLDSYPKVTDPCWPGTLTDCLNLTYQPFPGPA